MKCVKCGIDKTKAIERDGGIMTPLVPRWIMCIKCYNSPIFLPAEELPD